MEISDFFLIFWLGHSERLDLTWVISFLFWFCDGMADSAARDSGRWADVTRSVGCMPRRCGYFGQCCLGDFEIFSLSFGWERFELTRVTSFLLWLVKDWRGYVSANGRLCNARLRNFSLQRCVDVCFSFCNFDVGKLQVVWYLFWVFPLEWLRRILLGAKRPLRFSP